MKREHDPIIGFVSATGDIFTMRYKRSNRVDGIVRRGYNTSVFDEAEPDTPIVRFDLVEDIVNVPIGVPFTNTDYHAPSLLDKAIGTTQDEVAYYRSRGVTVQRYDEYMTAQ